MEKNHEIKVLDKGYVKVIDWMGTDLSPVMDARVSTQTDSNPERDDALRSFLWEHQHTSCFESMILQVEIKVPLFVLRQIERHRTLDNVDGIIIESVDEGFRKYFAPNEQSGRYSEFKEEYYIPEEVRSQDYINKQGSIANLSQRIQDIFKIILEGANEVCGYGYRKSLREGVAKEQARSVLNQNIYTVRRLTGSFLNWANFLKLRIKENAQNETRRYALTISDIIKELWPKSYSCLEEFTFTGRSLSGSEFALLRNWLQNSFDEMGGTKEEFRRICEEHLGKKAPRFIKKLELNL